jgi:hypothetical protein
VAAIRALPSRKGVELWMADVTTGRTLTRQLVVDEEPTGPDYNLVALQTAEILSTSLLRKSDPVPPPNPPPVPPVPPAPPAAVVPGALPPPGAKIEVAGAIGSLYSLGGVEPSMQTWVSLRRRSHRGFGVGIDASVPIVPGSLSGIEGSSRVGAFALGIGLSKSLLTNDSRGFLQVGLGGGILFVKTTGTAEAPLSGSVATAMLGHGYAMLDGGWKVSDWLKLGGTLLVGTAFKGATIDFVGNRAGTFGRLMLGAGAGLTLSFD